MCNLQLYNKMRKTPIQLRKTNSLPYIKKDVKKFVRQENLTTFALVNLFRETKQTIKKTNKKQKTTLKPLF